MCTEPWETLQSCTTGQAEEKLGSFDLQAGELHAYRQVQKHLLATLLSKHERCLESQGKMRISCLLLHAETPSDAAVYHI